MTEAALIRRATLADFDGVAMIFAETNRFHAALVPHAFKVAEPATTRDWFEGVLADPAQALFVALLGKEIAGALLVTLKTNPDDPIYRPRRYAFVEEVAVATVLQGQGLGRALMAQAEHWALAQGVGEIELHVWDANEPAIALYEKIGYLTSGRTMRRVLGPAP